MPVLRRIAAEPGGKRLMVSVLKETSPRCSPLCSSLLQFMDELEEDVELVTIGGGDVVAPPGHLREMALAMQDENIGTTLGNRFYTMPQGRWGSLVRHTINMLSLVSMRVDRVPWAASMAMRPRDIRAAGLPEIWAESVVEDARVRDPLESLGLKMLFVPQLFVSYRDEVSLGACFRFLKRQFLWMRLYYKWSWALLLVGSAVFVLILLAPAVVALASLWMGEYVAFSIAAAAWWGFIAAIAALIFWQDGVIRRMLRQRGENLPPWTPWLAVKFVASLPLTFVAYLGVLVACQFARRVEWRGIAYEFGSGVPRMVEYRPYAETIEQL